MVFENVDELADDIRVLFKNGDGKKDFITLFKSEITLMLILRVKLLFCFIFSNHSLAARNTDYYY